MASRGKALAVGLVLILCAPTFALLGRAPTKTAAPSRSEGSRGLDRANRCRLLPADPASARIVHGEVSPSDAAAGGVQLRVGDDLSVLAPVGVATSPACRQLVAELGDVSAIDLGRLPSAIHQQAASLQLKRAYKGAAVRSAEHAATSASGSDATGSAHSCDVLFTRRGLGGGPLAPVGRLVCGVPGLSAVLSAATSAAARLGRAQLTPTFPPPLTLRLLRFMPWRVQRLAARAWVQSSLPPTGGAVVGASARHPMEAVRSMPMLDASACDAAIAEAEAYAAVNGWLTDRHVSYPTTDIGIDKLPRLRRVWEQDLFPQLEQEVRQHLFARSEEEAEGAEGEEEVDVVPLDVFVVRYAADGQRELAVHRDNGLLTLCAPASPATTR